MSSDPKKGKVLEFAVTRQVKAVDKYDVELEHPVTKEKLGLIFTFTGRFTPAYRAAQRALLASKSAKAKKGGETEELDQEVVADGLVAFIEGWEGVKDVEGNDAPCTPENVRAFLTNPSHGWAVDQLTVGFTDRSRFFEPATNG
jgi:hypothetical protein